jgi:hypothetical protein
MPILFKESPSLIQRKKVPNARILNVQSKAGTSIAMPSTALFFLVEVEEEVGLLEAALPVGVLLPDAEPAVPVVPVVGAGDATSNGYQN